MIRTDETALICDLAETYGVLDYRALPLKTVAALSSGLRENSRIKMKITGMRADANTLLMAAAVDRLSLLVWMQTKDGHRNRNRPQSIWARMTQAEKTDDTVRFRTAADFEAARMRILAAATTETTETDEIKE